MALFTITKFVHGKSLSDRLDDFLASTKLPRELPRDKEARLHSSLVDVYIQLRRLKFPSIACLVSGSDGGAVVKKKTITIDINAQELRGPEPYIRFSPPPHCTMA